jgi:hypothetical protein
MGETGQQRLNRAITVGAGTFIWVLVLGVVLGDRNGLMWSLLLGAWIALGSAHLVENISDFGWKMPGRKLLLAALVSPAWPWLRRMPRRDQN